MKTLTNSLTKLTILTMILLVVLTVNYLRAWNGPAGVPPLDNVATPLNSGTVDQEKVGGVKAGSFWSTGGIQSDTGVYYFGNTQTLYSDLGSYGRLVWKSGHPDRTQIDLLDGNNIRYGKVYGGNSGAEFGLRDRNNNWSFRALTDNVSPQYSFIDMHVNGDPKMTIRNDGKVGIGTNDPQAKLHVEGDVEIKGTSPGIKLNDTDGGERNWQITVGANNILFRTDRDANGTFDDNPHPLVISNGDNLTSTNDDYSTFANDVRANEYCDRSGENCINPASLTLECVSGFRKDDADRGINQSTLGKTYVFNTVFNSGETTTPTGDQPWIECVNDWVMTGCSSGTRGNTGGGDNDEAMLGTNRCTGDQIGDNKISGRCCRVVF